MTITASEGWPTNYEPESSSNLPVAWVTYGDSVGEVRAWETEIEALRYAVKTHAYCVGVRRGESILEAEKREQGRS